MKIFQFKKFRLLWNLSSEAYGKYKKQILVISILGFLNGLFEAIGINAIIPLFAFIGGGAGGNDFISVTIKNVFEFLHLDFEMHTLLIFIASLFIFKAFFLFFSNLLKAKITADYELDTRDRLFKNTLKANWSHLLKSRVGYLENVLMSDVRLSSVLLQSISAIILVVTTMLMYLLVAINISWQITLITMAVGLVMLLSFKPLITRTKINSRKITGLKKDIAHYVNENIIGIKTVKSGAKEDVIVSGGKNKFFYLRNLEIKNFLLASILNSFTQPISLIFIIILFVFFNQSGSFDIASFVVLIYLIEKIFTFINQIQSKLHKVNYCFPFLQSVLNYQKDIIKNKEEDAGGDKFSFEDNLKFDNVSFSYQDRNAVLSNVNFKVKKGDMIGLIGSSGVGKTTIVDLILRLFQPSGGRITIDGKDANSFNMADWRKGISYVSQDIFLINGTIADNIRFYNPDVSQRDIERVAKITNIYDFINSCPKKFNTSIGDRGVQISTGQRQRIILARALATNPKFLILDEATSALDNESELKIQKVVDGLKGKITVFVIAHRLSTVLNCDKLMVLDSGKIIEEGEPKKLLADKETYFNRMYNIRN